MLQYTLCYKGQYAPAQNSTAQPPWRMADKITARKVSLCGAAGCCLMAARCQIKGERTFVQNVGRARRAKANQQWLPAEQGSLNIRIL